MNAITLAIEILSEDMRSLVDCHAHPDTGVIPADEPEARDAYERYCAAINGLEALAALSAQEVPQAVPAGEWVDIAERVPDKGTDCLIWSQEPWEKAPSLKQDRWDEIHEAPVSFSTNTVYVGDGWVDDHTCVTHWMKAPAGPGAAAPAAPKQAEAPALPERLMRFLLRDLKAERADLEGFLSLGNEVKRAAEYDEWIAAVEAYCQQYAPAAPRG